MPLVAWAPDVDRPHAVYAPALDLSQVTEVEQMVRPTHSVLLSGYLHGPSSAMERARLAIDALGGQIEDSAVRRASGRVHVRPVEVSSIVRGRLPRGF